MGEIATDRADSDSHLKKMFYKLLEKSNSKVFDGWEEYQKEIPYFSRCNESISLSRTSS
ncbi:hypothetical protein [Bacillus sp. ISL-57]|uniref:hypothetical protein n=1 Tax=Bacillus sp. ISL-57 TaxID=2819135 RepID=UPI001BEC2B70|nr:hypothetical protein [Bacillus sp. ISL-57]